MTMEQLMFRPMTEDEIATWYHTELCEAFPPQERKPLADILRMRQEGRYALWGLWENGVPAGYAALWRREQIPLVLLDYLGVTAARRNCGLGGQILSRLRQQGLLLVIESELPCGDGDDGLRLRRLAFYRRQGFSALYPMATCGMAWQAMVSDRDAAAPEQVMAWHRALYGPERKDVRIPLPPGEQPDMPYWMK